MNRINSSTIYIIITTAWMISFDAGIMEVPGGKKKQILVPPQIVWRNIRSQNGSIEYPQPNEKGTYPKESLRS